MKQIALALTALVLAGAVVGSASAQLLTPQPTSAVQPQRAPAPAAAASAPVVPPRVMEAREVAVLQVLDKVSARVTTLRVPVGSSAAYGLIFVAVRSCQVAPPSEPPESAAFLEISEVELRSLPRSGGAAAASRSAASQKLLFSGWMFASSPALSALEHPTYDVTVLACEQRTPTPAQVAAGGEEGGAAPAAPASASSPASAPAPASPPAGAESVQPED